MSIAWVACEPSERISDRDYWQQRVEQGFTIEELCYFVRKENQYSFAAWKLLVQRGASIDHFRHIAVKSLLYQPSALKYIYDHCRSVDDLLFVLGRSEDLAFLAAGKCVSRYDLTSEELCAILNALTEEQQIELLIQIRTRHKRNVHTLESSGDNLPEPCRAFFAQIRSETEEGLRTDLKAEKRKSRIKAAQKLVRQFPSMENCALAIHAIEIGSIVRWTQPIVATCLSKKGINWKRVCTVLPEYPPIGCNECVQLLVTLGNKRDALRTLLVHSSGFRRFAAAALLNMQPVSTADIALILTKAPCRYRKRATQILLQRKGASLRVLVLAWRRTYDMRGEIENVFLRRKTDTKMKGYLEDKAPDLLVRLNKHRGQ
ncbi:MAG: hypothetical protein AAB400_03765 [Patescibacteria group bacterium]